MVCLLTAPPEQRIARPEKPESSDSSEPPESPARAAAWAAASAADPHRRRAAFLRDLEVLGASVATRRSYSSDLDQLLEWLV